MVAWLENQILGISQMCRKHIHALSKITFFKRTFIPLKSFQNLSVTKHVQKLYPGKDFNRLIGKREYPANEESGGANKSRVFGH